jgi:hypothetical protein
VFSVFLVEFGEGEVVDVIDVDFESFIIDHGPLTPVILPIFVHRIILIQIKSLCCVRLHRLHPIAGLRIIGKFMAAEMLSLVTCEGHPGF